MTGLVISDRSAAEWRNLNCAHRNKSAVPRRFWVYILASKTRVLYIGVTNELQRRVWEHRKGDVSGFTAKYNVKRLIYYEEHATAHAAISREKQLKRWRREKKVRLIEQMNPRWLDFCGRLVQPA